MLPRAVKDVRVSSPANARLDSDVIWFCVPDSAIAKVARDLSARDWKKKVAFHSSGVLPSHSLDALRRLGAAVASVHPLMTFVHGSLPELCGVSFALEGDLRATQIATRIVSDLGGESFLLRASRKPAYHAFATMICPLLVSLLASAEKVAALGGIPATDTRRRMLPIIRQTLKNYAELGPAAFSGPVVRGDVETIALHLKSLRKLPDAKQAYAALIRAATEYLPAKNVGAIRRMLEESTPKKTRRSA